MRDCGVRLVRFSIEAVMRELGHGNDRMLTDLKHEEFTSSVDPF